MSSKGYGKWLVPYALQRLFRGGRTRASGTSHIIICVVDHFEPGHGKADPGTAASRVDSWARNYPSMADKHKDADGVKPQHTWFYPPHHDMRFLNDLTVLCRGEYGEIEMHMHHNRMDPFPDMSETLRAKILKCIEDYSKHGIFCQPDGSRTFGFIHGDWSLDNSRGPEICGVNDEIKILKECGCYADFTFPSLGEAQPAMINKVYYCKDDPVKPKSYNKGKEVRAVGGSWGDLMMIPGIIGFRWRSRTHRFKPSIESSNLGKSDLPAHGRIDYWINNAIAVKGLPEWKLIKLHTHGAPEESWEANFGAVADEMYSYLEKNYNDGKIYSLHYVTAREMYNIIKAAESGKSGNPGEFRDFIIKPYAYK
ncbi:MAG: hypothetical protein A2204_00845 [Elusimicrobia bacterium RIFOXYA1_FULL_47_7]|nr:MAG: hypothetical protein A2278_05640 [Elusimicrobia bacterium RIFOXYA12_FULL_49_49]OGS09601.1 MAG: hypothetical protein A2204_00845 [Elusimicrobia bacterium RIFOXYA1_FULL_47_7]OGS11351.1 MAG: hypothetical protein A2386_07740 [Elusimicrobia bacterium RIFOXYB1_FULL_48_9]OGS15390.1 MAG: hypothetical protein A2251_07470 [Elusimicrobia bacterium RIFOXYA2_FULL_47_53]OGS26270.1 MAG: hypothetical protein A2339_01590 [Elusimicrobia bacterium RIFOXYB12_FULL_50_12]OGS30818.1 MAG: hypothetical protein